MEQLTDVEVDMLIFERFPWTYGGAKENAIRDLFDCSATRYYQRLNALIDRPAALVAEPVVVNRLRRLRRQRAARGHRSGPQ
jgi:hypothetical protein